MITKSKNLVGILKMIGMLTIGLVLIMGFSFKSSAQPQPKLVETKNPYNSITISKTTDSENKEKISVKANPGESKTGTFYVINTSSSQTVKVKLYSVDTIKNAQGNLSFKSISENNHQLSKSVSFSENDVILAPWNAKLIEFKISVPENFAPGKYIIGVAAEINSGSSDNEQHVQTNSRSAEAILVQIPGNKVLDYKIDNFDVKINKNLARFSLDFINLGNVFLSTEGEIRIKGTGSQEEKTIILPASTIFGQEKSQIETETGLNNFIGFYKADLTLRVKEYDFETGKEKTIQTFTKTIEFNIVRYDLIFNIVLGIFLLFAVGSSYYFYKYFQNKFSTTHKVKKGENIGDVAKKHQISWQKIAKFNKLKRPYTLKENQILKIPPHQPSAKKSSKL